jgi:tryptophan-rich sensory protein
MNLPSITVLFGFIGACFLAATSGALFRPGEWYEHLRKPVWRPPNWLFAPAWSVLYLTIAISGWLVWRRTGFTGAAVPFTIYGISLLFNAAWPAFFFGLRRPDLAFVELMLLWFSIVAVIWAFYPVERNAALLLLPYIAWVTFAGALNLTIWQMNRVSERV